MFSDFPLLRGVIILFFLMLFSVSTSAEEWASRTFVGHTADVMSVSYSPDGDFIATGSLDGTLRLWNVSTGLLQKVLAREKAGILSIAYSPDGGFIATGHNDTTLCLWDVSTGQQIRRCKGHGGAVLSVSYSPDGLTLASASVGGTVILWDVSTGERLMTLTGHEKSVRSVAYSPDGVSLATGSDDGTLRLWDVATGREETTLARHQKSVGSVSYSPDGLRVAAGNRDGKVLVWDVSTGRRLRRFGGQKASFTSVSYSTDGRMLATGHRDNTVSVWDVLTGSRITTLRGHRGDVESVAFSPDGLNLATGSSDDILRVWQLPKTRLGISPDPVVVAAKGRLTMGIDISGGLNIKGYQIRLGFDPSVLSYVEASKGGYLPASAFVSRRLSKKAIMLTGHVRTGTGMGAGRLATLTFDVLNVKASWVFLSDAVLIDDAGGEVGHLRQHTHLIPSRMQAGGVEAVAPALPLDVNSDGLLNDLDYQVVESNLGHRVGHSRHPADVNGDGLVDIRDLLRVAAALESGRSAGVSVGGTATPTDPLDPSQGLPRADPADVAADPVPRPTGALGLDDDAPDDDAPEVASVADNTPPEADPFDLGALLGETDPTDVNGDGELNLDDLLKVAGIVPDLGGAPGLDRLPVMLNRSRVRRWLKAAERNPIKDRVSQRGVVYLTQLLAVLPPEATQLLANYPNPFNPETWIPYQLSKPADVMLTIYASNGQVVRQLALGHQPAGTYESRSRAAYWDGKNELREPVASGVYFYTLTAGDFTATRKMLIQK